MPGFTLRPMTPADKPAVLAIASRTWEGGDYLPFVFDDWIADTDGEFVAVLLEGRVVGSGKLTFLTPHDAWLEGLRKNPEVTEGGLAETVNRYFLRRLAGRPGLRSVRFSTSAFNTRSIAVWKSRASTSRLTGGAKRTPRRTTSVYVLPSAETSGNPSATSGCSS